MQIGSQGVHNGDLVWAGADNRCRLCGTISGHVLPGFERRVVPRGKVAMDADGRPRL